MSKITVDSGLTFSVPESYDSIVERLLECDRTRDPVIVFTRPTPGGAHISTLVYIAHLSSVSDDG